MFIVFYLFSLFYEFMFHFQRLHELKDYGEVMQSVPSNLLKSYEASIQPSSINIEILEYNIKHTTQQHPSLHIKARHKQST